MLAKNCLRSNSYEKERIMEREEKPHRCPGESYTISDSVCRGRQRVNYPKCNVCLDKVEPKSFNHSQPESKLSMGIFKSYDIRGKYPAEIDDLTGARSGLQSPNF